MIEMMPAGRPAKLKRTPLGQRMAEAREKTGLTQTELGERLGVSQRVIANWERKPVALRAEQLAALADALSVSADFLLGRLDAKSPFPKGRLREVFEKAHKLPRTQQNLIVDMVEAYVDRFHSKTS